MAPTAHVDVLIVGAGLSGIGAASHLVRDTPDKTFLLLERREAIGGTWDLFTYPGIRSDSDMFTFGYSFRPWNGTKVLADGPSIRNYIEETAREYGVTDKIRFGRKVTSGSWSSADQQWTLTVVHEATGREETYTANYVIAATGYYNYDEGYRPEFPGEESFAGQIVHPQHWPNDLDYKGKQVVVIGSGATAVTLVPSMAADAGHVTMLQRSPTYIMTVPESDFVSAGLRRVLPDNVVYQLGRARNIGLQRSLYLASRTRPGAVRKMVLTDARRRLGSKVDIKHFSPNYNPWDQRLCVVPNGDLFRVLRKGQASIMTDRIVKFTPKGVLLESGRHVPADIIVTATGLNIQMMGGATLYVDGEQVDISSRVTYKGTMIEGVPNATVIFGYTNASWTLKADIVCEYTTRLLNHMSERGYTVVVPHAPLDERTEESVLGSLASGYVQRGNRHMPRQGKTGPWKVVNDYMRDLPALRFGRISDANLEFRRATGVAGAAARDGVRSAVPS